MCSRAWDGTTLKLDINVLGTASCTVGRLNRTGAGVRGGGWLRRTGTGVLGFPADFESMKSSPCLLVRTTFCPSRILPNACVPGTGLRRPGKMISVHT